jgi:hypothetical protein
MNARKHTPVHDYWYRRLEPQVEEVLKLHPNWFAFTTPNDETAFRNSILKRIVGVIIGAQKEQPKKHRPAKLTEAQCAEESDT